MDHFIGGGQFSVPPQGLVGSRHRGEPLAPGEPARATLGRIVRANGLEFTHESEGVGIPRDDAIHVEHRLGEPGLHEGAAQRVRVEEMIHVVAGGTAAGPGLAQLRERFTGAQRQVPPMHSALKKDGKALYEYARAGQEVEREARDVVVHALDLSLDAPDALRFTARVSKGTYIRTLGEDMGEALGCGAHLASLRRVATGPFGIAQCVTLEAQPGSLLEYLPDSLILFRGARLRNELRLIAHPQAVAMTWDAIVPHDPDGSAGAFDWIASDLCVQDPAGRVLARDRYWLDGALLARRNPAGTQVLRSIENLLGATEDEFRERAGWEWVLEAALRRSREEPLVESQEVVRQIPTLSGPADLGRVAASVSSDWTRARQHAAIS